MPGTKTTDAWFVEKRMQGEYRDKEKKLCMYFVNIEMVLTGVPRKMLE